VEIIKVVVLFEGWLKLLRAEVKGTMGKISHRLIEDHGSAVAILPYDPTRRTVLLISQFRPPVEHGVPGSRNVLEPIAGRIDDGDPDASARREAMEEAGVELAKLELVATCWSMPAVSTERIYLYLAPYALENRVAPQWRSCRGG
jgi:nudix-type nucleoside diphosphatase (YffH/AdpP family)